MSTPARRIAFRFGLTGRRWGDTGPVVLFLHGRESAPRRFDELVEPLLASGRQVIELDDPTDVEASNDARVSEYAAAISEVAVEIPQLESALVHGLGAAAAAQALPRGLPVERLAA